VVPATKQAEKKPGKKSQLAPILILGWGADGADDVEFISRAFPNGHGLDCVKAPYADSRRVLKEISSWLNGNSNAQILYVGAHRANNGLVPEEGKKNKDKIGHREFGETLLGAETELIVWVWVSFADRPDSEIVQEVLALLIEFSGIRLPWKTDVERELSYLEEDALNLKSRFPRISIYYRASQLVEVDQLPSGDGGAFLAHLGRECHLDEDSDELPISSLIEQRVESVWKRRDEGVHLL
jgi:hypothetical protein